MNTNIGSSRSQLLLMFYYDGHFPWNVPLLLYYPSGIMYKVPFRYQTKWIPSNLQHLDAYPLREALIVLKFYSLEDPNKQQEYIPMRKVHITKCEIAGDYYYLYMKLGPMVRYSEGGLNQFSSIFIENLTGADRNFLVYETPPIREISFTTPSEESSEINSWLRMAKLFNSKFFPRMTSYESTAFLKLHSIYSAGNQQVLPKPIYKATGITFLTWLSSRIPVFRQKLVDFYLKNYHDNMWGYIFNIGEVYTIKLIQFFRPDPSSTYDLHDAQISIKSPTEALVPIKSSNNLIGHQDVLTFSFNVVRKIKSSSLSILNSSTTEPTYSIRGKKQVSELFIPDIDIPIRLKHSPRSILLTYVIPILIFLFGSLFITTSTSEHIPLYRLFELPKLLRFLQVSEPLARVFHLTIGIFLQAIGLLIYKME